MRRSAGALSSGPPPRRLLLLLACLLTTEEFRGGHKARREIPPVAFFVRSSGFLECRVTLRPAREAPFGPSRRSPAGFRLPCRGAHRRQERRETPKRPPWRQPPL